MSLWYLLDSTVFFCLALLGWLISALLLKRFHLQDLWYDVLPSEMKKKKIKKGVEGKKIEVEQQITFTVGRSFSLAHFYIFGCLVMFRHICLSKRIYLNCFLWQNLPPFFFYFCRLEKLSCTRWLKSVSTWNGAILEGRRSSGRYRKQNDVFILLRNISAMDKTVWFIIGERRINIINLSKVLLKSIDR